MDHPETDRVLARELESTLKDLRDKNKKLTDEKKAAEGKAKLAWVMAAALFIAILFAMCSGHGHHHFR